MQQIDSAITHLTVWINYAIKDDGQNSGKIMPFVTLHNLPSFVQHLKQVYSKHQPSLRMSYLNVSLEVWLSNLMMAEHFGFISQEEDL